MNEIKEMLATKFQVKDLGELNYLLGLLNRIIATTRYGFVNQHIPVMY